MMIKTTKTTVYSSLLQPCTGDQMERFKKLKLELGLGDGDTEQVLKKFVGQLMMQTTSLHCLVKNVPKLSVRISLDEKVMLSASSLKIENRWINLKK